LLIVLPRVFYRYNNVVCVAYIHTLKHALLCGGYRALYLLTTSTSSVCHSPFC